MRDAKPLPAASGRIYIHLVPPLLEDDARDFIRRIKKTSRRRDFPHADSQSSSEQGGTGPDQDEHHDDGEEAREEILSRWTIRTRYYTSAVHFSLLCSSDLETINSTNPSPAVIILSERTQKPSEATKEALEKISEREEEWDVALLVSQPHSSRTTLENGEGEIEEEAWDDLAIEYGFEWVDISPSHSDEVDSTAEKREKGEGEEPEGMVRIIAALQAHIWENMIRHAPPSRPLPHEDSLLPTIANDKEDDDEGMMGPSLLPARPLNSIISKPIEFPSTFLPSLHRSSLSLLSTNSIDINSSNSISIEGFEDDFSPFVPATALEEAEEEEEFATDFEIGSIPRLNPSTHFPPFEDDDEDEREPPLEAVYEPLEDLDQDLGRNQEKEAEDLESLFEQIAIQRKQAEGMTVGSEERRVFAEKVVLDLFGAD